MYAPTAGQLAEVNTRIYSGKVSLGRKDSDPPELEPHVGQCVVAFSNTLLCYSGE